MFTTYTCQHCGLRAAMSAMEWMWHRLTVPGHLDKYGRILPMSVVLARRVSR